MPTLAACLIVKNEAANLPRCLASVAGVVDEIIVADTGSTDESVAVAEAHGARVFHFTWVHDFARARNAAIDAASSEWVLVLDADEELTPAWKSEIGPLLSSATAAAFRVVVENLLPESEISRSSDSPSVRLVRNLPGYRYERPIHEQIRPTIERLGGEIADTGLRVLHHGYLSSMAQGASRAARNQALLEQAALRSPRDPWVHFQLGMTAKAMNDHAGALRHLKEAFRFDRGSLDDDARARAHCAIAQIHLGARSYVTAAEAASRALSLAPESILALHVLALATIFGGDVRGAAPLFERVRRSPSCHPERFAELDELIAFARRAA